MIWLPTTFAVHQDPPVRILVQLPIAPKLENTTRSEVLGLLRDAVEETLRLRLSAQGYSQISFVAVPPDGSPKISDLGPGAVLVIRLERWDQKNISHSDMLNNPNRPKSETKVWTKLQFVTDGKADQELKKEGFFGGGYFGTTDRYELRGAPAAVAYSIRTTNRQRLEAIANAIWDAVKFQFPKRGTQ